MKKLIIYLRLIRPANIITSVADVLAGIGISGFFISQADTYLPVLLLCIATIGLYAGGIVFNDIFDAELDKIERPERAIPSGAISIREALTLGIILLAIGVTSAFSCSLISGIIAFLIAIFALIYDKFGKHHSFLGPLNMGLCRGLNLLLGLSILSESLTQWYFLGIIPLIYIFSITMVSQGEVHGSGRNKLYTAAFLYFIVISFILYLSWTQDQFIIYLLFMLLFTWMIFKTLIKAIQDPIGKNIGLAVKAGVISLILMDAAWAAAFGSVYMAVFIVTLLPVSLWLAKQFAVT